MDEKQIDILTERILKKIKGELFLDILKTNTDMNDCIPDEGKSLKHAAYVVLPKDFSVDITDDAVQSMERLAKNYKVVLVVPDRCVCDISCLLAHADFIIKRSCVGIPAEGDVCVFISASRDLIVKSALCLKLGFESSFLIDFVEMGNSVFLLKEKNTFNSREPKAYKKKIEAYESTLAEFGVHFNCFPNTNVKSQSPDSDKTNTFSRGRKIITARDIKGIEPGENFYVTNEDIVTAVAKETADKFNINIICR